MAFKKIEDYNSADIYGTTKKNWASALDLSPIVSIPLVYLKTKNNGIVDYHGFTPGLSMNIIVCSDLQECHTQTLMKVKNIIKDLLRTKDPIPFFPTDEEIRQDYENVCAIKRIILDTTKKD